MKTVRGRGLLFLAFGPAACRADSTAARVEASRLAANDPDQFSDWSAPVNSDVLHDRPTLAFDGTALYFQSPRSGGLGANDIYVLTRSKLKGQD